MKTARFFVILIIYLLFLLIAAAAGAAQTTEDFIDALLPKNNINAEKLTGKDASPGTARGIAGKQAIAPKPRLTMLLPFNLNSAELRPDAIDTLKKLGMALQSESLKGYLFRIEGHTCNLGTNAYNKKLSQERATAVRDYLSKNFDLNHQQFKVAWFGEERPAFPNTDEAARQKNRRVVIINTLEEFNLPTDPESQAVLQIKCYRDGIERIVKDGEAMDEHDRYSAEFKVSSQRYVYIFQVDSRGNNQPLFPNKDLTADDNPVELNRIYRVPSKSY